MKNSTDRSTAQASDHEEPQLQLITRLQDTAQRWRQSGPAINVERLDKANAQRVWRWLSVADQQALVALFAHQDAVAPEPASNVVHLFGANLVVDRPAIGAPAPTEVRAEAAPTIDRSGAENFLAFLDPGETRFSFQCYDDNDTRKELNKQKRVQENAARKAAGKKALKGNPDPYAKTLHGTLAQHFEELKRLNEAGAAVCVTINRTNLKGRKGTDIISNRTLVADLDGAPLEPVRADPILPQPHIVVESSPGRWHTYWLMAGLELTDFTAAQLALAAHFKGDPSVSDLPRVMRLPGFVHRKGEPFVSRIVRSSNDPPYPASEFLAQLKTACEADPKPAPEQEQVHAQDDGETDQWREINSKALKNLTWVLKIFPNAIPSGGGYRVPSSMLNRDLEEDLCFHPTGIKDFGVHDLGDPRDGKRTPIDIVLQYLPASDVGAAADWLREMLGLPKHERSVSLSDFHAYLPQHVYINGTVRSGNAPPRRRRNADVRAREYLVDSEIGRLIDAAGENRNGHRDATTVLVAYRHGLRAAELVTLRWDAIDFTHGRVHVGRVKGSSESVHPLSGRELRALRRVKREQEPASPFVFTSERGSPFTTAGFRKMVARLGLAAGFDFPVHPHMLRHACGYKLANDGVDTRSLQAYLGHKNIAHTVRYTELAPTRFKNFWRD